MSVSRDNNDQPGSEEVSVGTPDRLRAGAEEVIQTLTHCVDRVVLFSESMDFGIPLNLKDLDRTPERCTSPENALSYATGLALTGYSVGVFVDTTRLDDLRVFLKKCARMHLPMTIVCTVPAIVGNRTTGEASDGILDVGSPVLESSTVQETCDFTVIACAVAKAALLPVVILANSGELLWALQQSTSPDGIRLDVDTDETRFFRNSLFGDANEGVPRWVDTRHPVSLGVPAPGKTALKQRLGQIEFVERSIPSLFSQAFAQFSEQSGRHYSSIQRTGPRKATSCIVTAGIHGHRLEVLVKTGIRSPVIVRILLRRPFPVQELRYAVEPIASVGILDSSGGLDTPDGGLYRDVQAALKLVPESRTTGKRRKNPGKATPRPTGYRPTRLFASAEWIPDVTTLNQLSSYLDEQDGSRNPILLESDLAGTSSRLPVVERMNQRLLNRGFDFTRFQVPGIAPVPSRPTHGIFALTESAGQSWRMLEQVVRLLDSSGATNIHGSLDSRTRSLTGTSLARVQWDGSDSLKPLVLCTHRRLLSSPVVRSRIGTGTRLFVAGERSISDTAEPLLPVWLADAGVDIQVLTRDRATEISRDVDLLCLLVETHELLRSCDRAVLSVNGVFPVSTEIELTGLITDTVSRVVTPDARAFVSRTDVPPEPRAPAEVAHAPDERVPAADLNRFWQTTGYLYGNGRSDEIPIDPLLASGALPARSATVSGDRRTGLPVPEVIPECCTGCAACWSICPESALISRAFTVEELLDDAISRATGAFVHTPRFRPALIQTMHRLIRQDELHRFLAAPELISEAFESVLNGVDLAEDRAAIIDAERDALINSVQDLPLIRTESWFTRREFETRGSGLLLTLAADPAVCTSCGLCYAVCPEDALQSGSPPPPVSAVAAVSAMSRTAFESSNDLEARGSEGMLTGPVEDRVFRGGGAESGNTGRSVVRLFLESVHQMESVRLSKVRVRIQDLIERIDHRLQTDTHSALDINDFEAFTRSLREAGENSRHAILAELLSSREPDDLGDSLAIFSELRGKLVSWMEELGGTDSSVLKPHLVVVNALTTRSTGMEAFPFNPFAMPVVHTEWSDLIGTARGLYSGLTSTWSGLQKLLRKTEQLLENVYDTNLDAIISDRDRAEILEIMPALVLVTDQFDLSLLRLLKETSKLHILLLTGAGPETASISVTMDPVALAGSVGGVFACRSSVADPVALAGRFLQGLQQTDRSFHYVYAPDAVRDGIEPCDVMKVARSAFLSEVWVDAVCMDGATDIPERLDIADAETPGTAADWMIVQNRFSGHFKPLRKAEWSPDHIPVTEWLDLNEDERKNHIPYAVRDDTGTLVRFLVDDAAAAFSIRCRIQRHEWESLARKEHSALCAGDADETRAESDEESTPDAGIIADSGFEPNTDALARLRSRLLELSGFGSSPVPLSNWLENQSETINE